MRKSLSLIAIIICATLMTGSPAWAAKLIHIAEDVLCGDMIQTHLLSIKMRRFPKVAFLGRGLNQVSGHVRISYGFANKAVSSLFSAPPEAPFAKGACTLNVNNITSCHLNAVGTTSSTNNLVHAGGPYLAVGYACDSDAVTNGFRFDLDIWLTR